MKFRIFTSMLLVMFLSMGSASVASAHEGCGGGEGHCCGWHHGWGWGWGHHWGCNNYIYGPDGLYAQCRDGHMHCCNKDKDKDGDKGSENMGDKDANCCHHHCCGEPVYRRAYYHEDCCGYSYLSCEGHKSCCDKKDKDEDNDNDK